ncbi:hypothetical protein C8R44DRAFT_987126 [Mycena epipterygia]|nr:hypothetical protein C8R44DRAFT_987126 [Mycena epipterygia]
MTTPAHLAQRRRPPIRASSKRPRSSDGADPPHPSACARLHPKQSSKSSLVTIEELAAAWSSSDQRGGADERGSGGMEGSGGRDGTRRGKGSPRERNCLSSPSLHMTTLPLRNDSTSASPADGYVGGGCSIPCSLCRDDKVRHPRRTSHGRRDEARMHAAQLSADTGEGGGRDKQRKSRAKQEGQKKENAVEGYERRSE